MCNETNTTVGVTPSPPCPCPTSTVTCRHRLDRAPPLSRKWLLVALATTTIAAASASDVVAPATNGLRPSSSSGASTVRGGPKTSSATAGTLHQDDAARFDADDYAGVNLRYGQDERGRFLPRSDIEPVDSQKAFFLDDESANPISAKASTSTSTSTSTLKVHHWTDGMEGRVLAAGHSHGEEPDCHCDGTAVHCTDATHEEHYSCATGALVEIAEHDCHCDGTAVHCTDATHEEHYSCATGALVEIADMIADCHCDGTAVHCTDATHESMCHCDDGEVHCDGSTEHDDDDDDDGKPWKEVLLATLLVNVAAFTGVVVLIPTVRRAALCGTACGRAPPQDKSNRGAREVVDATDRFEDDEAAAVAAAADRAATHQDDDGAAAAASSTADDVAAPPKPWTLDPKHSKLLSIGVPSFACGALLAAAVFLIIPESLHLIQDGKSAASDGHGDGHEGHNHRRFLEEDTPEESEVAWKFGCALLGGFLMPVVLGALFPRNVEHLSDDDDGDSSMTERLVSSTVAADDGAGKKEAFDDEGCNENDRGVDVAVPFVASANGVNEKETEVVAVAQPSAPPAASQCRGVDGEREEDVEASDIESTEESGTRKSRFACARNPHINYRLCASILLGDGIHNFADGVFVGIGFLLCTNDVAVSIMAATLYHEIAQELADFFLLTQHAGLGVLSALALNFLSGMSVMLGGITVLAINDLTNQAIGVLLGIAAGVYFHIGASECVPRIDEAVHDFKDRALSLLLFVLGAVPIGLVLLNHEHC